MRGKTSRVESKEPFVPVVHDQGLAGEAFCLPTRRRERHLLAFQGHPDFRIDYGNRTIRRETEVRHSHFHFLRRPSQATIAGHLQGFILIQTEVNPAHRQDLLAHFDVHVAAGKFRIIDPDIPEEQQSNKPSRQSTEKAADRRFIADLCQAGGMIGVQGEPGNGKMIYHKASSSEGALKRKFRDQFGNFQVTQLDMVGELDSPGMNEERIQRIGKFTDGALGAGRL